MKIVNSGAAGDIYFGEIHMAKKREHRGGWGMQRGWQKWVRQRPEEQQWKMREPSVPRCIKKSDALKKRAKALTSPPPVTGF